MQSYRLCRAPNSKACTPYGFLHDCHEDSMEPAAATWVKKTLPCLAGWVKPAITNLAGSVTEYLSDLTSLAKQDVWLWSKRLQQQAQHRVGG